MVLLLALVGVLGALVEIAMLVDAVGVLGSLLWRAIVAAARAPLPAAMWACAAWVARDGFVMIGRDELLPGLVLAFGAPYFTLLYTAFYARMRLPAGRAAAPLPPAPHP